MRVQEIQRRGISVAISAYNEATSIRGALESVRDWADEIIVVDCESDDQTESIAREYTSNVLSAPNRLMLNVNKNVGIDAATCEWVLVLDPDERVTRELAAELRQIASGSTDIAAFWMPRRNHELGRWIRHMGAYPDLQLRFFRNGAARFPCEHIHESVIVEGPIGRLEGALDHWPRQSLFEYVHKRNLYSEHRAAHLFDSGVPFKRRNLFIRPIKAFAKQYIAQSGWREGVPGLIIGASGAYGTFLQDAKLWQRWTNAKGRASTSDPSILRIQSATSAPVPGTGDRK